MKLFFRIILLFLLPVCTTVSCKKSDVNTGGLPVGDTPVTTNPVPTAFDINSIQDTYSDISSFQFYPKWSVYNVHDPSIKKFGDYYYCYSTDAAFGITVRPGIQVRKSKDLVEWNFVGWAFPDIPNQAAAYIRQQGGEPFNSIWAPFIMKAENEYRLYYSLSSPTPRLSAIGLATSSSPEGPWKEGGLVVTSENDNSLQTNAIDPAVVTTPSGEMWMYYGSAWDGIYILKLDPSTGLALKAGDKGIRVAQRGYTGGTINGNIEAPDIIYNESLKKYFLFISYDWLETKYNVRVGRADSPEGPFYDYNGNSLNVPEDHGPMILAPYKFNSHGGWQGTGHCTLFTDNGNQYFMGHQGRPSINKYFMDLHIRKVFWTEDGWPVVSPERFAWEENELVARDSIIGSWELISLNYRVVPGFQDEQVSPDLQTSIALKINENGTLNSDPNSSWTYSAPWLVMSRSDGTVDKVFIQDGRDWELKNKTIIFTGLDNNGRSIWGKKNITN